MPRSTRRSSTRPTRRRPSGLTGVRRSAAAPRCGRHPRRAVERLALALSHRVNDLAEIEQVLELTDDEREGLSAPEKFRVDITPYFIRAIRNWR